MSVLADPEQQFRVEGVFDVPWMNEAPLGVFRQPRGHLR